MKHPALKRPDAEAFARRIDDAIHGRPLSAAADSDERADLLLAQRLAGLRRGGVAPSRPPWLDRPAERRRLAWLPRWPLAWLPGLRLAPVLLALVAVLGLTRLATLGRWSAGADGKNGTAGTDRTNGTYRTNGTNETEVPQEPAATPATDRPLTPIGSLPAGGPADEPALPYGSHSAYGSHPEASATHHPTTHPPTETPHHPTAEPPTDPPPHPTAPHHPTAELPTDPPPHPTAPHPSPVPPLAG